MKKYYIDYYLDFGNTYHLAWAETPEQIAIAEAEGSPWEHITLKEAEAKCANEDYTRKCDPSFSGYGDNAIYPIDYDCARGYIVNDCRMRQDGYLWLYK